MSYFLSGSAAESVMSLSERGAGPFEPAALFADARAILALPHVRRIVPFYLAAAIVLFGFGFAFNPIQDVLLMVALVIVGYVPIEYLLHRYVFHSLHYLAPRSVARAWIRVHYAHHRSPSQEDVILGSPPMFLGLLVALNIPIALIAPRLCLPYSAMIFTVFALYEIVHYSAHTGYAVTSRYFRWRRKLHLLHHYHDDKANFGILTSIMDRIVGTLRVTRADTRSPTAFNLGYFGSLMQKKPLVREEYERKYPDTKAPLEESAPKS
jgi:sterol desaturase/sphingolipid hydroxylase (fatty acid hydroxylase superfamily)